MWWRALVAVIAALVLFWLALLVVLWRTKPEDSRLREAGRILPDVLRLISRLARDNTLRRGVRVRLWLLLGYLALPFDIVPDFIPVVGYADDAVLVALILRSVVHSAGDDALSRHWPGTADGLDVLRRLCRLDRMTARG